MWFGDWLKWKSKRQEELLLTQMAIGINSAVDITKDLHIILLDFDTKDLSLIDESVRELQAFWNLADMYYYRTKNGYHVIGWFDQVPYSRLRQIIEYAKYVDPLFKYISRYFDHKTLRATGKHEFGDIVFYKVVRGVRDPTLLEMERGEMKRKEHTSLIGSSLRQEEKVQKTV